MRTAAIFCNVVLFAIMVLTLLTEGVETSAPLLALTGLALLVPLLTTATLVRWRSASPGSVSAGSSGSSLSLTALVVAVLNLALLVGVGWAAIARYPYSEGNGIIPFVVLAVGTPALSLIALLADGSSWRQKGRQSTTGDAESHTV